MPKNSIADQIVETQNLVITVKASAAEVPGIDLYIVPLEQVLEEAIAMNARLETRKGMKQQDVQDRRALLAKRRRLVSRVRAALKAHYGLESERLVEFGSRPIRSRSKAKTSEGQVPTTNTPPAPAQAQIE
jgi:hypothetical protein